MKMTPEAFAEEHGMTIEAARNTMARYAANPHGPEFAPVLEEMIAATGVRPEDVPMPPPAEPQPTPSPVRKQAVRKAAAVRQRPLAILHPEEPVNRAATLANTSIYTMLEKWFTDWDVPVQYRDYWKTAIDIQVYETYPPSLIKMGLRQDTPAATWDAGGKRHLAVKPAWLNPGVIAHEQSHNSYALLTASEKAAFSAAYGPLKTADPLIRLLYLKNRYGLTNDIEGHAEVYRYLGREMPPQLKAFYPRLF